MIFEKQFLYQQWSNIRLFEAVKKIDIQQFPDQYHFARQQFNHIAIVEELFKARLLQQKLPHQTTNSELLPDLDKLARRIQCSNLWYIQFIKTPNLDWQSPIDFQFTDGQLGRLSIEEILFHVINHGSYHRGNIAHALHLANLAHPADTYTVFIHEYQPERRIRTSS